MAAGCGGGSDPAITEVVVLRNGDMTSGLAIRHEASDNPRLAQFVEREQLQSVVAGARDEFDLVLRLREWTASQFPLGSPNPYPPWDAIDILDWIRGGITGGFCAQYAQILLQALAAFGLQARYIEAGLIDNPYAHYLLEVWSNQHDKWVLIDPDYNMHFERGGVPMGALEVHLALVSGELSEVRSVLGTRRAGHSDPARWPLGMAELYKYLRVHLKADHLSRPNENPFDRYNDMVEFLGPDSMPWESSTVPSPYPKERLTNQRTSDATVFDGKLNQTLVAATIVSTTDVVLTMQHNLVEFSHFEQRPLQDGMAVGNWSRTATDRIVWRPTPKASQLEVRGVNRRGVGGPPALIASGFS